MRVYNTLTRRKEEFVPLNEGQVKMYVCGPTTYDQSHLGHARSVVSFDIVYRYLQYKGYDVTYVQNLTDVDDKIIERARQEGVDPLELAEKYIDEFNTVLDELGIARPTYQPRVSEHVEEIIELVEGLLERGYAYEVGGSVYFDVANFASYGQLSGRNIDEMRAGARVEVETEKRHPMDFVLWKSSQKDEIGWESPWGWGRPGWHIECSALSLRYLGAPFDIHGGGLDLVFPHHENELAQSEACTCESPCVKYWLHNGFVTVDREKMSKSLGNFFTVRELLERYEPEALRLFLLSAHYRTPIDYAPERIEEAERQLERLYNTLERLEGVVQAVGKERKWQDYSPQERREGLKALGEQGKKALEQLDASRSGFVAAMDDDFNTARALAQINELARTVNALMNEVEHRPTPLLAAYAQEATDLFTEYGAVLGILQGQGRKKGEVRDADEELANGLIEFLLDLRSEAREEKNWELADRIRDELAELGIILEDTPHGTRWKREG